MMAPSRSGPATTSMNSPIVEVGEAISTVA
jgi:hypothetical protein